MLYAKKTKKVPTLLVRVLEEKDFPLYLEGAEFPLAISAGQYVPKDTISEPNASANVCNEYYWLSSYFIGPVEKRFVFDELRGDNYSKIKKIKVGNKIYDIEQITYSGKSFVMVIKMRDSYGKVKREFFDIKKMMRGLEENYVNGNTLTASDIFKSCFMSKDELANVITDLKHMRKLKINLDNATTADEFQKKYGQIEFA